MVNPEFHVPPQTEVPKAPETKKTEQKGQTGVPVKVPTAPNPNEMESKPITFQAQKDVGMSDNQSIASKHPAFHGEMDSDGALKKLENAPKGAWLLRYSTKRNDFYVSFMKGASCVNMSCKDLSKLDQMLQNLNQTEGVVKETYVPKWPSHTFGDTLNSATTAQLLKDKSAGSWLIRYSPNQKQWVVSVKTGENEVKHLLMGDKYDKSALDKAYGKKNLIVPDSFKQTVAEKRTRAIGIFKNLYTGVSKGNKPMAELYHAETIDTKHGYGRSIAPFFKAWKSADTNLNFNEWMQALYDGKNVPGKDKIEQKHFTPMGAPNVPKVEYLVVDKQKGIDQLAPYKLNVDRKTGTISNQTLGKGFSTQNPEHAPHIFVVDPKGNIYVGVYKRGSFNHSSFLSGAPVMSAGELIVKEGKIVEITDKSGHYETSREIIMKGLMQLHIKGVDLSNVTVTLNAHPLATKPKEHYNAAAMLQEYIKMSG